jgi:hypothetical protein
MIPMGVQVIEPSAANHPISMIEAEYIFLFYLTGELHATVTKIKYHREQQAEC